MIHRSRRFRLALVSALLVASPLVGDAVAMKLQVLRRLDVGPALGNPAPGFVIQGIAHDGASLWLVHPSGASVVQVDPQTGQLLATIALIGTPPVVAAGMAAGGGSLWIVDAQPSLPVLLRVDPTGQVMGTFPLQLPGGPTGIDFQAGDPGPAPEGTAVDLIRVGYRTTLVEGVYRYRVEGPGVFFDGVEEAPLPGAQGRTTASFAGGTYTWITAPRAAEEALEGDPPTETAAVVANEIPAPVADRSIPRGGEDVGSTQTLALIDTSRGALVTEVHIDAYDVLDLASDGQRLYMQSSGDPLMQEILVAEIPTIFDVQYGTCVCRDVLFFHQRTFSGAAFDVEINFAHPWDNSLCIGPTCPGRELDGTGGYLAQEVRSVLDPGPPVSSMQTVIRSAGTGSITRHNREIFLGDLGATGGTVTGWHEIRTGICEAAYTILPSLVSPLSVVPADIRDLYAYDGDGDGFGDDNPATDIDDYFTQDSSVVNSHLLASGALAETNLYYKVRAILHYVKGRHVYSGADGGWDTPENKLQSPYASCSPSAFMVVALAREAGIPARLVGTTKQRTTTVGGAWRDSSFHRWAQVYMPPYGWVRVDATPSQPWLLGFTNVNGDTDSRSYPIFNECDLCTSAAQCTASYGLNLVSDCGLSEPVNNPNDVDGDGTVDGDDVEVLAAGYYTDSRLEVSSFKGVGTKDLITMVDAGMRKVSGDFFQHQYISLLTHSNGAHTGNTRYADWRQCQFVSDVTLGQGGVAWQTSGPFDPSDSMRVDVYRLIGAPPAQEYEFVANLARDVPASDGFTPIDLGGLAGRGNHAVVVTRQGGPSDDVLTSFSGADWETFGESAPFLVGAPGPPAVPGEMTVQPLAPPASDLLISWNTGACAAAGHHILFGDAEQLPPAPGQRFGVSGSVCSLGASSPFVWTGSPDPTTAAGGLIWFLLVADDAATVEGSWSSGSDGFERAGPGAGGSSPACGILEKDVSNTCGTSW